MTCPLDVSEKSTTSHALKLRLEIFVAALRKLGGGGGGWVMMGHDTKQEWQKGR